MWITQRRQTSLTSFDMDPHPTDFHPQYRTGTKLISPDGCSRRNSFLSFFYQSKTETTLFSYKQSMLNRFKQSLDILQNKYYIYFTIIVEILFQCFPDSVSQLGLGISILRANIKWFFFNIRVYNCDKNPIRY